jgi:hypothetical protein
VTFLIQHTSNNLGFNSSSFTFTKALDPAVLASSNSFLVLSSSFLVDLSFEETLFIVKIIN